MLSFLPVLTSSELLLLSVFCISLTVFNSQILPFLWFISM
jgi:hypothetical protein